ncbi:MAG TPA: translation initiation factor IF-3 [Chloroflexota bacterium]|nr:translation initiation factor IF-3 [Chloroflexota bacterium]
MARSGRHEASIRAEEVWLFDEDGSDLGYVPAVQAQAMARERGLDLVQLDQMSSPPRCRLARAATLEAQAARAARVARGATAPPKEIRLRVQTGAADLATRQRSAASSLAAGHRVKIRVELDPGQRSNPAPARAILDGMVKALASAGAPEAKPFNEKGAVAVVLVPR